MASNTKDSAPSKRPDSEMSDLQSQGSQINLQKNQVKDKRSTFTRVINCSSNFVLLKLYEINYLIL